MQSKSVTITKQLRYQKWVEEVRACNNRPDGMSVRAWCKENGINPPTYYDHLHKVKELCINFYETADDSILPSNNIQVNMPSIKPDSPIIPAFVEVPIPVKNECNKPAAVTIICGQSKIEITESISDAFLLRILGALNNAQ